MYNESNKFTILWHSVAPFINSGYGRITHNITTRLANAGYKVIVSAYYGIEQGGMLNYNGVYCLPSKDGSFGIDSAIRYAKEFAPNVSFLATDWWAFPRFPYEMPNSCLYGPMDMVNYPEEIVSFTKKYWKIFSLCDFQKDMLKNQMGIDSVVIPHGVDTKIFRNLDKKEIRRLHRIPVDMFVFGTVNANSDKEMGGGRKAWGVMFKALRHFLDQNPDIKASDILWLIHSDPADPRGYPLIPIAKKYNLESIVKFSPPEIHRVGLPDEQLVQLYNSFDVFLGASKREGFSLTTLEAIACGVPVISHSFSAMKDLVTDHGWLVRSVSDDLNMEMTPILSETAIPDVYDLADKMKDAFFNESKRNEFSKKSIEFAKQFDWNYIFDTKWLPAIKNLEQELASKPITERRLL